MAKKMLMKLLKRWGEYKVGDVAMFDQSKAAPLMKQGVLEKAKPTRDQKSKARVETAVAAPKQETAMVDTKPDVDAKAKARADTKTEADVPKNEAPPKSKSMFGKKKER